MITYAVEFHEWAAGRIVVPNGSTECTYEDLVLDMMEPLVYHFESGPVHTSKEFHPMIGPVLPLSNPELEPFSPLQFRTYAVPDVVEIISNATAESRVSVQYHFSFQTRGPGMDP